MNLLTRRTLLAGSALAGAAGALPGLCSNPAAAATPPSGQQAPGVYRYKVGSYELTALNDGVWMRPLDDKFVRNAPLAEIQKGLTDNFLPSDKLLIPFSTLLVNTGSKLILIDTGTGGQLTPTAGTMMANMAAAGVDPKAVDTILISHFHPDHINGIKTKDGQLVFPNAEISVPAAEWAFWMDDAKMNAAPEPAKPAFLNARRIFGDIAQNVKRFEPGQEVAPGITAIAAYGHTPGHTAFAISSGNQSLLLLGDAVLLPVLFVRNPDWQAIFDADGAVAADNRKKLLDRAAADRMLVQGYHFPFPASGYITRTPTGYDLVPVMWQSAL
jgi:glyoxylase-like metal-dependent hydrolase (beta-lactamase superfamily II)